MNIGKRIKKIRLLRGMTQKELGLKLGFPENAADVRVAQYESGARVPKSDLLNEIAKTLNVSSAVLTVGVFDSVSDIFNVLFALEDECGLRVNRINNRLCLVLENNEDLSQNEVLISFLGLWHEKLASLKNGKITKEQYDSWRYNYSLNF